MDEARARRVRFKVVGITQPRYRSAMRRFGESIGLTDGELEVVCHEGWIADGDSIHTGFEMLSSF